MPLRYKIIEEICDLFRIEKSPILHKHIIHINMKVKYVSIFAIFLVLLSGVPLISDGTANYANARYANTQTQANTDECEGSTNCGINSPQTQGDGSASSPTNLQISGFGDE